MSERGSLCREVHETGDRQAVMEVFMACNERNDG